jgi:molecular chaperone DnaK
LASSDQRDNERVPTFLRVRLKFADVDTFIEKYSTNISLGGIFIQSRSPKPPGTVLKFELALESGESLIRGEGQVTWVKEFDANSPGQPFGMGVRFASLDPKSRALVDRAVAHRQGRAAGGDAAPPPSPTIPPGTRAVSRAVPRPERSAFPTARADIVRVDAELLALMREAGLDDTRVARAAKGAASRFAPEAVQGDLRALLNEPAAPAGRRVAPAPARAATPVPETFEGSPPPAEEGQALDVAAENAGETDELLAAVEIERFAAADGEPPAEPADPASAAMEMGTLLDMADAGDGLEGADFELESLQGAEERPEITAVGTPPRFDEAPEEEPPLFPDREVVTPPPESASPLFDADSAPTPSDPGRVDEPATDEPEARPAAAADRWATAAGPESANLDAELMAAIDKVIDHSEDVEAAPVPPAPARAPASPAHESEKKGKGLLGRLFRKK